MAGFGDLARKLGYIADIATPAGAITKGPDLLKQADDAVMAGWEAAKDLPGKAADLPGQALDVARQTPRAILDRAVDTSQTVADRVTQAPGRVADMVTGAPGQVVDLIGGAAEIPEAAGEWWKGEREALSRFRSDPGLMSGLSLLGSTLSGFEIPLTAIKENAGSALYQQAKSGKRTEFGAMLGGLLNQINLDQADVFAYLEKHPELNAGVIAAYERGYNGKTGDRAAWEFLIGKMGKANRILIEVVYDPTSYLFGAGVGGRALAGGRKLSELPAGRRVASGALQALGGVDTVQDQIVLAPLRAANRATGGRLGRLTAGGLRRVADSPFGQFVRDLGRPSEQQAQIDKINDIANLTVDQFSPARLEEFFDRVWKPKIEGELAERQGALDIFQQETAQRDEWLREEFGPWLSSARVAAERGDPIPAMPDPPQFTSFELDPDSVSEILAGLRGINRRRPFVPNFQMDPALEPFLSLEAELGPEADLDALFTRMRTGTAAPGEGQELGPRGFDYWLEQIGFDPENSATAAELESDRAMRDAIADLSGQLDEIPPASAASLADLERRIQFGQANLEGELIGEILARFGRRMDPGEREELLERFTNAFATVRGEGDRTPEEFLAGQRSRFAAPAERLPAGEGDQVSLQESIDQSAGVDSAFLRVWDATAAGTRKKGGTAKIRREAQRYFQERIDYILGRRTEPPATFAITGYGIRKDDKTVFFAELNELAAEQADRMFALTSARFPDREAGSILERLPNLTPKIQAELNEHKAFQTAVREWYQEADRIADEEYVTLALDELPPFPEHPASWRGERLTPDLAWINRRQVEPTLRFTPTRDFDLIEFLVHEREAARPVAAPEQSFMRGGQKHSRDYYPGWSIEAAYDNNTLVTDFARTNPLEYDIVRRRLLPWVMEHFEGRFNAVRPVDRAILDAQLEERVVKEAATLGIDLRHRWHARPDTEYAVGSPEALVQKLVRSPAITREGETLARLKEIGMISDSRKPTRNVHEIEKQDRFREIVRLNTSFNSVPALGSRLPPMSLSGQLIRLRKVTDPRNPRKVRWEVLDNDGEVIGDFEKKTMAMAFSDATIRGDSAAFEQIKAGSLGVDPTTGQTVRPQEPVAVDPDTGELLFDDVPAPAGDASGRQLLRPIRPLAQGIQRGSGASLSAMPGRPNIQELADGQIPPEAGFGTMDSPDVLKQIYDYTRLVTKEAADHDLTKSDFDVFRTLSDEELAIWLGTRRPDGSFRLPEEVSPYTQGKVIAARIGADNVVSQMYQYGLLSEDSARALLTKVSEVDGELYSAADVILMASLGRPTEASARFAALDVLTAHIPKKQASKLYTVWSRLTNMIREGMLMNVGRGISAMLTDNISNAYVSLLIGNPSAALNNLRWTEIWAMSTEMMAEDGIPHSPVLEAIQAHYGFTVNRDVVTTVNRDLLSMMEPSAWSQSVDDVANLLSGKLGLQAFREEGRIRKGAQFMTQAVSSKRIRALRHMNDVHNRASNYAAEFYRKIPEAQERFWILATQRAEKLGADVADWQEQLGDVFDPLLVKEVTGDTALSQSWLGELRKVDREAADVVNKNFFSYKMTRLDDGMRQVFLFHYWQTRAIAWHAQHTLRNPALIATYVKAWEGMERDMERAGLNREGQAFFTLLAHNSMAFLLDPLALLVPLSIFREWGDRGDESMVDKILRQSNLFLNPMVQAAATSLGFSSRTADITGTGNFRMLVTHWVQTLRNHGLIPGVEAGLTPDPIQLGQTSLYRFMNRITSPWNPFDGEMEARDWKASARDDINEIIIHQAELEFGPYGSMQPEQLREIWDAQAAVINEEWGNTRAMRALQAYTDREGVERATRIGVPGNLQIISRTEESRDVLSQQGYDALQQGGQPTAEEQSAMLSAEQASAGSVESIYLTGEQNYLNNLGSAGDRETRTTYYQILNGGLPATTEIEYGGIRFPGSAINGLPEANRKEVAKNWLAMDPGRAGALERINQSRDAYTKSSTQLEGFNAYKRAVGDADPLAARQALRRQFPEFARKEDERRRELERRGRSHAEIEAELSNRWLFSTDAYLAVLGAKETLRAPEPLDPAPVTVVPGGGPLGASGSGSPFGNQDSTAPGGQLRQELAAYLDGGPVTPEVQRYLNWSSRLRALAPWKETSVEAYLKAVGDVAALSGS